ncbi:heterokaryon incompatibility protein-domain-containing protein [Schizothecium vesticola]|uniref:Heterokaryon incompatibility protein-domain-containing protein n=1 Tax=Schizothecium vesticola TaxID=314040 RepID=A0AA40EU36_9PEZI|nr:heterokaryon incompatibility protein-domain-containing protein [Schizothecium vesticola]
MGHPEPTTPRKLTGFDDILVRILYGFCTGIIAMVLDYMPSRELKTVLIITHVGTSTSFTSKAFGSDKALLSSFIDDMASLGIALGLTTCLPPHRLALCYMGFVTSKYELKTPALQYMRFQDTDEENLGLFLKGLLTMACFVAPTFFLGILRLGWNNSGTFFGVGTGAVTFTSLAVQYPELLVPLRRLYWLGLYVLHFVNCVYNGVIDHTSLRVAARHFEAWEARRSQKACAELPQLNYDQHRLDESKREFRILKLQRRTLRSELRCEFVLASVNNPPPFEAISYTWGGEQPTESIIVNGCRLAVAPAVFKLLWYRRSFWSEAYLWIDAVCINQHGIPERERQVKLMGDIYQLASRTLVWLAHPMDAMDAAKARRELMVLATVNLMQGSPETLRKMLSNSSSISALVSLLSLSYFTRIWVVQEVVLAKEVHVIYGHAMFDWDSLIAAVMPLIDASLISVVTSYSPHPARLGRNMGNILCISRLRMQYLRGSKPDLYETLAGSLELRWCASTDARDKVFGVLGMVSDAGHGKIPTPDYGESAERVFLKTCLYLLEQTPSSLALLQFAGIGYAKTQLDGLLPSWVPDWTNQLIGSRILRPDQLVLYLHRSSSPVWRFTAATQELNVDTKILDTALLGARDVLFIPPGASIPQLPPSPMNVNLKYIDDITVLAHSCAATRRLYPEILDLLQAIFGVLIGAAHVSIEDLGTPQEAFIVFLSILQAMQAVDSPDEVITAVLQNLLAENGYSQTTDAAALDLKGRRLFFAIGDSVGGKRFCVLESGKLALCPPGTKEGDLIANIRGAPVPFGRAAPSQPGLKFGVDHGGYLALPALPKDSFIANLIGRGG